MLCIPDIISEHNYRAIGSKNPRRSAKTQANYIRNKCEKAKKACGLENEWLPYVNWSSEVEISPAYVKALSYVKHLYEVNETFRSDIRDSTELALDSLWKIGRRGLFNEARSFDFDEGVLYALKELAFFTVVPEIYEACEECAYIYHKHCGWLERFFDGEYDGIVRPYFGFYVFE